MSAPVVKLTSSDVIHAALVGFARNVSALVQGRSLEAGRDDDGFAYHVRGAKGELALSIYLDRAWRPLFGELDTLTGDVAGEYQVKSTDRPDGRLIVRKHDPDRFPYVLAIARGSAVTLVGWLMGEDAKRPQFWRSDVRAPAYFVPQSELHPLATLPRGKLRAGGVNRATRLSTSLPRVLNKRRR